MRVLLETDRLVLLRFTGGDVDNVVELDSDPEVMRYLTGGTPTPREVVREDIITRWLAYYERYDGYGFWAVIEEPGWESSGLTRRRWRSTPPPGGSWRRRACAISAPVHQDWPERIPGDEHGEVEYALTKAEWEAEGPGAGAGM